MILIVTVPDTIPSTELSVKGSNLSTREVSIVYTIRDEYCVLSTNQRRVLSTINQSDISIVYYQPIRDQYCTLLTNQKMSIVHHEPEMKIVQLSTNQRWVLSTINQSEISIVYYQPIRSKYHILSTNQK